MNDFSDPGKYHESKTK